ncbi:MAG: hypothetical protein A2268_04355 [Candidatus Raymondbacteria bacterium RifOxyA12_full_50_37]|nr:MAG: hypothetical protein A2268_04355 [Candidatus Raymondbacteria bacterium RifOxyA12_full_50_37]OGJ92544.1 MAG: hypothetical protein A2248_05595 [Candidatus Raymondbacteria bacterium RIFOXYA2_FULL_49_16]OGJ97898.1 MAG: hypothetical protein A2453_02620 [Candidatus Raymondbacteria bacterium RIFOXYC2_FULL_50_21]OGK00519.1 MAG: hypothetical protein A2350_20600 [Candidatus Raymondbacteria bacterium RifOxyB12_full_50_8]OGK07857.1 MAG: hypothetical protein A2487_20320 [Candidatus Raymondbacteria b
MRTRRTDFIVGFVITVALIILVAGVIYLKEYSIGKETRAVYALFEDIGTLSVGDPVKINGVKMGKVVSRELQGNMVLVGMEIDATVVIPSDSRITIQNVGLMGERMIGVRLGSDPRPIDPAVPMKGYFDSGIAEAMGMLGEVFGDAKELVVLVRKLADQTVANDEFVQLFKTLTQRLDRLSFSVERLVNDNEAQLNTVVKDVQYSTTELKSLLQNNRDKIQVIVDNLSTASVSADQLIKRADKIANDAQQILAKIASDSSTVGQIMQDKELYSTLKSTVTQADSLLKTINKQGKLKVKIGF